MYIRHMQGKELVLPGKTEGVQRHVSTARVETGRGVCLRLREVSVTIISWPKGRSDLKQGLLTNEAWYVDSPGQSQSPMMSEEY